MQGYVRLRNALECISETINIDYQYCYNQVGQLTSKAPEKTLVASAADCKIEADSPVGRPRAQAQRT